MSFGSRVRILHVNIQFLPVKPVPFVAVVAGCRLWQGFLFVGFMMTVCPGLPGLLLISSNSVLFNNTGTYSTAKQSLSFIFQKSFTKNRYSEFTLERYHCIYSKCLSPVETDVTICIHYSLKKFIINTIK